MYTCRDCGSTFDYENDTCPVCGGFIERHGQMRPMIDNLPNKPMKPKDHFGGTNNPNESNNYNIGKIVIITICILYILYKILNLALVFVDFDELFREIYEYKEDQYGTSYYQDKEIYEV